MKYLHRLTDLGIDVTDMVAKREKMTELHTAWLQARQEYARAVRPIADRFHTVYTEEGVAPTVNPATPSDIEGMVNYEAGDVGLYLATSAEEAVAQYHAERLARLQAEINALMEQTK